jgi:uncharacterized protein YkwD
MPIMKGLGLVGGVVILIGLGIATAANVSTHTNRTRVLVADERQLAAAGYSGDPAPQRMIPPSSPEPSPITTPAAGPPAAAPPAAAPPAAAPPAAAPVQEAPPAAPAAIVIGSAQQALINQDRAEAGLGPLTWSSCLASVADSNAARMAGQGFISHTNGPDRDLGCGLGNQAGENVGYWSVGINDSQLNTMFMASPEHRANIMGPYRYIATSWVQAGNGYGYIAVELS